MTATVTRPKRHLHRATVPKLVQVLELIAEGYTNDAIAHRLNLSVNTVKSQVVMLCDQLDARDRAHAVAQGFRRGWLS